MNPDGGIITPNARVSRVPGIREMPSRKRLRGINTAVWLVLIIASEAYRVKPD